MRHEGNGGSLRKKEQNLRDQALVWKVFPSQYFLLAPTLAFAFCKLHPRRAKARPKDEGVFPKSMALVRCAGLRAQGPGGLGDRYLLDKGEEDPYLEQRAGITAWPKRSLSGPVVHIVLPPRTPLGSDRT